MSYIIRGKYVDILPSNPAVLYPEWDEKWEWYRTDCLKYAELCDLLRNYRIMWLYYFAGKHPHKPFLQEPMNALRRARTSRRREVALLQRRIVNLRRHLLQFVNEGKAPHNGRRLLGLQ